MKIEEIRNEANKKVLEIMNIINNYDEYLFLNLDYIQYRIKSEKSIINKMKKVGDNIFDVYDLIGVRYVFKDMSTSEKLKNIILNDSNFTDIEVRDYCESGHPEDPDYKAIHLRTKYQEYPCEIQIMDTTMFEHVTMTHTDYKNGLLK